MNCGKEIISSNYVWKFSFEKKNLRDVQEKNELLYNFLFGKKNLIDFMVKKENIPKSTYSFQRLGQGAV